MKKKTKRIIKTTLLSFFSFIFLAILIAIFTLHGRIATMMSVRHVGNDLYTMNYQQTYHLNKALKAEIRDEDDLFEFVCDDVLFGIKIKNNISKYACSAFSAETPDGKKITGRNFDLGETDTLCVYTHPKGGYSSIATVSTDMIAVGGYNKIKATSFLGRGALLAAPYMCVDGMNEKGLCAALLDMSYGETHMDTDKPDLIVSLAIRLLLDKAKNVDEAVNLLKKYDIQTAHGWTQHIFISDKSGKSVIAEWVNDEVVVVDYNVCTNFWMSDPALNGNYSSQCKRFDSINNALKENNIRTKEESMEILEGAMQDSTEWSVVFDKTDFKANYTVDGFYSEVYNISPNSFAKTGLVMILIYLGFFILIGGTIFLTYKLKKKKNNKNEEIEE